MTVKNISATIITLRSKAGVDKINPLETKEISKENEKFAEILIKENKLESTKEAKATKEAENK